MASEGKKCSTLPSFDAATLYIHEFFIVMLCRILIVLLNEIKPLSLRYLYSFKLKQLA